MIKAILKYFTKWRHSFFSLNNLYITMYMCVCKHTNYNLPKNVIECHNQTIPKAEIFRARKLFNTLCWQANLQLWHSAWPTSSPNCYRAVGLSRSRIKWWTICIYIYTYIYMHVIYMYILYDGCAVQYYALYVYIYNIYIYIYIYLYIGHNWSATHRVVKSHRRELLEIIRQMKI